MDVLEPTTGDAFGQALLDFHRDGTGEHAIERIDGYVEAMSASVYFTEPDGWFPMEIAALPFMEGRILDVGAGAGRVSLELQKRGQEVIALDTSAGAIEVCRERGVKRTHVGDMDSLAATGEQFDTAVFIGHNLGLIASAEHAPRFFDAARALVGPSGRIVGTSRDPYGSGNEEHLRYHDWNRQHGRMPGRATIRVRYKYLASDWWEWLFVSQDELRSLAAASGWKLVETTDPDPSYLAVLEPM